MKNLLKKIITISVIILQFCFTVWAIHWLKLYPYCLKTPLLCPSSYPKIFINSESFWVLLQWIHLFSTILTILLSYVFYSQLFRKKQIHWIVFAGELAIILAIHLVAHTIIPYE